MELCKIEECTGCMACVNSCARSAIDVICDDEGFSRPQINIDECIDCGLCRKVCPVLNETKKVKPLKALSGWSKKITTRMNSSSGGFFTELATIILNHNGVVFGCTLDDSLKAVHTYIESIQKISKFQGSKYVQSEIGESYKQVKKFLKQGRNVLFSGTPCQVAGLKSF